MTGPALFARTGPRDSTMGARTEPRDATMGARTEPRPATPRRKPGFQLSTAWRAGLLSLGLCACSHQPERPRQALLGELVAEAHSLSAPTRAADDYHAYQAAVKAAEALASDDPARDDVLSTARAHLEAAIAHADRQRLADARLAEERLVAVREQELLAVEAERETLAAEADVRAARAIVQGEIERAYARLDASPAKRPKLARDEVRVLAGALLARAELLSLALVPEALSASERDTVSAKMRDARASLDRDPDRALGLADDAQSTLLGALGQLRSRSGQPSDADKAALVEALTELGIGATRGELGLSAGLGVRARGAARLDPTTEKRRLERVCKVVNAHPQGRVHLLLPPPQAERRADEWKAQLTAAGCSAERLGVLNTAVADAGPQLIFDAY